MAQPRPSLTLILDIDERFDSEETRLEVGRCYTYVGTALVRTHKAEGDAEPENIMRMLVKLGTRKYLSREDEESEALWNTVIERWLYNQFHTVVNNMQIFNRRQREIGNNSLPFTWLEIELENGALVVRLRLDSASGMPASTSEVVSRMRAALAAGRLGEGVCRISAPSEESFEKQRLEGLANKAKREEERRYAAEEAAAAAEQERIAAERRAEEGFLESPSLAAAEEERENQGVDIEELFALEEPDFELRYSEWTVDYRDGSSATFDSSSWPTD